MSSQIAEQMSLIRQRSIGNGAAASTAKALESRMAITTRGETEGRLLRIWLAELATQLRD